MNKLLPSELILRDEEAIYHLGLKPNQIAHQIILVGDQERVAKVSAFFQTIEHKVQIREFLCHTGVYNGKRLSVISTGIGTDNIDIVINELDALVNIDFSTRTIKEEKTSLQFVRIGTCGILQDSIPLKSYILSTHALGIDNVAHYYDRVKDTETESLLEDIVAKIELPKQIIPYLTKASTFLNQKLESEKTFKGITVTSSGFYGPQGRSLRLPLAAENMLESFHNMDENGQALVNLEMECSSLFALAKALGHEATAICLGLANRRKKEFAEDYDTAMLDLIQYVLDRI